MTDPRDIPILFTGAMVRGILADRKTMTRRILKPQPTSEGMKSFGESWAWKRSEKEWFSGVTVEQLRKYGAQSGISRWNVGDRLWVREAWSPGYSHDPDAPDGIPKCSVIYRADMKEEIKEAPYEIAEIWSSRYSNDGSTDPIIKPSIHMPRWASRITLEVTAVRVERLQDISEADAIAEGAEPILVPLDGGSSPHIEGFRELWTHINGADSWSANPWVSVTTFQRQPNSGAGRGEM